MTCTTCGDRRFVQLVGGMNKIGRHTIESPFGPAIAQCPDCRPWLGETVEIANNTNGGYFVGPHTSETIRRI